MDSNNPKNVPDIIDITTDRNQPFVIVKMSVETYNKFLKDISQKNKETTPKIIKGTWKEEEDQQLLAMVAKYGPRRWSHIARELNLGRNGKQCRERYLNHLSPHINKDHWTEEEDAKILHYQAKFGNQWAKIAKFLPGRTSNSIKNRWNSTLNKFQERRQFLLQNQNKPQIQFQQITFHTESNGKVQAKKRKELENDPVPLVPIPKKQKIEVIPLLVPKINLGPTTLNPNVINASDPKTKISKDEKNNSKTPNSTRNQGSLVAYLNM